MFNIVQQATVATWLDDLLKLAKTYVGVQTSVGKIRSNSPVLRMEQKRKLKQGFESENGWTTKLDRSACTSLEDSDD